MRFTKTKTHKLMAEGDGGGGGTVDWKTGLPPDLAGNESLKAFADVTSLAKSFIEQKTFLGTSVRIPGPDAGQQDWDSFYEKVNKTGKVAVIPAELDLDKTGDLFKRLGTPEGHDKYAVADYDSKTPEEKAHIDNFRQLAFNAKMTQKQFDKLVEGFASAATVAKAAAEQKQQEEQNKIDTLWGQAREKKVSQILNFLERTKASPDVIARFKDNKFSSEEANWYGNLVQDVDKNPRNNSGQDGGSSGQLTPMEATAQIQEILKNPAYWSVSDPQHAFLKKRMVELVGMTIVTKAS